MLQLLLTLPLSIEEDVVSARQRAREVAAALGFEAQDQTRIATAVSELARNAVRSRGGRVEFALEGQTAPQLLIARIYDGGPGIVDLDALFAGGPGAQSELALGLLGARRLVDQCEIRSQPGQGTQVELRKLLPRQQPPLGERALAELRTRLSRRSPTSPLQELQRQNGELLSALGELRDRQQELLELNRELEDTNRGVVALYAELEEQAGLLRHADEMKSRFLSNMSHEFRTPLHSIQALSRLLLDRADGPLCDEQDKQVRYIVQAAKDLTELVDDLLDLARIAAGKEAVRPAEVSLANLFSALRGMLRPLLVTEQVRLLFDEVPAELALYTDEGKLAQILRNLISNALKFTEQGEVRVHVEPIGAELDLCVSDTGIGIRSEDQERIFEEFVQAPNRLQARVKGSGLGLPLCRKLTQLLGGRIWVESKPGVGSAFHVRLPLRYRELPEVAPLPEVKLDPGLLRVLVVEDIAEERLLYEKYLTRSRYQCVPARSLAEARRILVSARPHLIVLDILLRGEDSWGWLAELKGSPATREIPVIVATGIEDERKARALGAQAYLRKPIERAELLAALDAAAGDCVLVVDDDPAARYLVQRLLSDSPLQVLEAADGRSGLDLARRCQPRLIFLDLELPDLHGETVLRELRATEQTREIPVAILTAALLPDAERARLRNQVQAVFHKSELDLQTARELLHRHGVTA